MMKSKEPIRSNDTVSDRYNKTPLKNNGKAYKKRILNNKHPIEYVDLIFYREIASDYIFFTLNKRKVSKEEARDV